MKRLNNKGFAVSGILYPLLLLFLMLLLGTLGTLAGRKLILDKNKIDIKDSIEGDISPDYVQNGLFVQYDGYNGPMKKSGSLVWEDLSGNSNDCTLQNFDTTGGWKNDSILFDGTNDTCAINNRLNPTKMTISLVIAPTNKGTRHVVFTRWYGYTVEINATGTVAFGLYPSAGYLTTTEKLNWDQPNYITLTYDGFQKKIYINDKMVTSRARTSFAYQTVETDNTMISHNLYTPFKGSLYEVLFYNRALTEEEVTTNYNINFKKYGS